MRRRHRLAVVALLIAAATAAAACAPTARTVTITIRHSAFEPPHLTVPSGVPVTFVLVNEDPIDHEWLIGEEPFHDAHRTGSHESHGGVPTEVTLPALETVTTTLTFESARTLRYVCHLPGHEAYGMVGMLNVEG